MNILFTDAVLLRSLILFLLLGSFVGLLAGTALILRPEWLQRISKFSNRWVSTRQMGRPLEQKVNIDHWFYKYGHVSGVLLLAGAIYILVMMTTQIVRSDLLITLGKMHLIHSSVLGLFLDALVLLFMTGAVLSLVVSLFLLFRPSMLRDLEVGVNRNVSMRQTLKPMEIPRSNMDQLVFGNVRIAGAVLLCGSLYTFVVMLFWLVK